MDSTAVTSSTNEAFERIQLCLGLLGSAAISWGHVPDPRGPLIADRRTLAGLIEFIPNLTPTELTIAVDILLEQEAMTAVVASWLINLTHQAEALVDAIVRGLRLRARSDAAGALLW